MDVVKSETASLGGRIEITSVAGRGTTFRIYLPLTLAVAQAVLVTVGNRHYAMPSSMIEQATEHKPEAAARIRKAGSTEWLGNRYPYHYLGVLLGDPGALPPQERRGTGSCWSSGGTERVALEVDSLSGNQEVVVKAVGPQLARIPGLAGATVLGNGEIALIINPSRWRHAPPSVPARRRRRSSPRRPPEAAGARGAGPSPPRSVAPARRPLPPLP
jgi:chemosensory pili system protein ChpA (sensor histidine kinase/response regulator)